MSTRKSRKFSDMASEYRFDYKQAKPNRFASRMKGAPLVAIIDPDVAKVFKTTEAGQYRLARVDIRDAEVIKSSQNLSRNGE